MLVLVAYDINTQTAQGRRRLRRVAKTCTSYGQRVQKSLFECVVGDRELVHLRGDLLGIIHQREDNLRLYFLGEVDRERTEAYGQARLWDFEGPLIV